MQVSTAAQDAAARAAAAELQAVRLRIAELERKRSNAKKIGNNPAAP
jgi:hypothetical protein